MPGLCISVFLFPLTPTCFSKGSTETTELYTSQMTFQLPCKITNMLNLGMGNLERVCHTSESTSILRPILYVFIGYTLASVETFILSEHVTLYTYL